MAMLKKTLKYQDLYVDIPFMYPEYRVRAYFTKNYLIDNFSLNIEFILEKFSTQYDEEFDESYGWNIVECVNYNPMNHYKSRRNKCVNYKEFEEDHDERIASEFFRTAHRYRKILLDTYKIYDNIL